MWTSLMLDLLLRWLEEVNKNLCPLNGCFTTGSRTTKV